MDLIEKKSPVARKRYAAVPTYAFLIQFLEDHFRSENVKFLGVESSKLVTGGWIWGHLGSCQFT